VTALPIAERRHRVELALATAVLVAAIGVAVLRVSGLPEVHRVRLGAAHWAFGDFRKILYYPAAAFLAGGNPFDATPYLANYPGAEVPMAPYAPVIVLAGAPFATLPLQAAEWCYFAITVALSAVLAVAAFRFDRVPAGAAAIVGVTAAVLLSRPGQWNLLQGQPTIALVLGSYAALAYRRTGALAAGIGLAVALVKPTFGVPLALLLLVRRDRRARAVVLAGVALAAVASAPALLVLAHRAGGLAALVAQVREGNAVLFARTNNAVTNIGRIDLAALITRPVGSGFGQAAEYAIGLALLAGAALLLRQLERRGEAADAPHSATIACAAVLLGTYHQGYDLLLLTAPAIAVANRLVVGRADERPARIAVLALLALLAFNFVTTESGVAALQPGRAAWVLVTSLNALALLAVFVLVSAAALRGDTTWVPAASQNPVAR
jgi:hypothetical protein